MDWYAWLSKTNLDASLIYEYGLALVRNELQQEDLPYFNHDFLQSVGISIAKHRLEILKLCRKEVRGAATNGLSGRLVLVMNKTRKLFARKLGFHKDSPRFPPPEVSPYRSQWSGALRRINGGGKENGRNVMWSGPLDRRLMAAAGRSGPLDVKMHERIVYPNWSPMVARQARKSGLVCKSPTISGPIDRLGLSPKVGYYRSATMDVDVDVDDDDGGDHDGVQSLWSIMFQDMKPT